MICVDYTKKIIKITHLGLTEVFEYYENNVIKTHYIENEPNPNYVMIFFGNDTFNYFDRFTELLLKKGLL